MKERVPNCTVLRRRTSFLTNDKGGGPTGPSFSVKSFGLGAFIFPASKNVHTIMLARKIIEMIVIARDLRLE